jgi:hypothetical protein
VPTKRGNLLVFESRLAADNDAQKLAWGSKPRNQEMLDGYHWKRKLKVDRCCRAHSNVRRLAVLYVVATIRPTPFAPGP